MRFANRLNTVTEYYFSQKLREIDALRAKGADVLNLAIGNPDLPPHPSVIEALQRTAEQPDMHGYQSYQGLLELRQAIADFSRRRMGIALHAETEILPLMGSKEGITHVSLAYLNPGDKVLIPSLGYPTYSAVSEMVEAEVIEYPLVPENGWEPDWLFFDTLDPNIKVLWINYPHMPTGTRGNPKWLERFVNIAKKNNLLLVHDNPYSFILNKRPVSIFSIQGSKDVALELNSLSKTFNMAGWRVGWVSGKQELVEPVLRIKSNMDSGMFRPVQEAAIKALSLEDQWYRDLNQVYESRKHAVFQLLEKLDCSYSMDQSGLFIWAKSNRMSGWEMVDRLLSEHHVFITPGGVFGQQGERYVRVSLCNPVSKYEEALNRLER